MEKILNLRFGGSCGTNWHDELRERINNIGLSGSVSLSPAAPPPGTLGAVDPTVVVAAITGGATIIASVITLLGALWTAKRKDSTSKNNQPHIVIVIHGSEATRTVDLEIKQTSDKLIGSAQSSTLEVSDTLLCAVESVGIVREVEVKEN